MEFLAIFNFLPSNFSQPLCLMLQYSKTGIKISHQFYQMRLRFLTLIVTMIVWQISCQSNGLVNVKFQQIPAGSSQTIPKNAKIMKISQLIDAISKNPQTLLELKNIYIQEWSIKNPQNSQTTKTEARTSATSPLAKPAASSLKNITTQTSATSSTLNLRTVGSASPTQNPVTLRNSTISNRASTPNDTASSDNAPSIIAMQNEPPARASSINDLRLYMAYLTNTLRRRYNVRQLKLNPLLTKIAQDHSNDMVRRNFFDHMNPDGEKVGDRAVRNGYQGAIGQNLAISPSLNQAQIGFERSQTHFTNAIKSNWEQMGVGIAFKGSMMYVTCLFAPKDISRNPLTAIQIQNYKLQLANGIKSKNPQSSYDSQLSQYIQEWLQGNRATPLLNYVSSRGQYRSGMAAAQYTMDYTDDFVSRAIENNYFNNQSYASRFGIGIVQSGSKIQTYVIYM